MSNLAIQLFLGKPDRPVVEGILLQLDCGCSLVVRLGEVQLEGQRTDTGDIERYD